MRATGGASGAFLYTPARFADMHGIQRVAGGPRGRVHQDHVAMMDARLAALGTAGFKATVSVAKKPFTIDADRLVYYAHTRITEGERRG
jgi:hypothetical protein